MNPDNQQKYSPPQDDPNAAADVIRQKLQQMYSEEPSATQEAAETESQSAQHRSRHQQFMHNLVNSGKSLAQIQTEWHNYYLSLTELDKQDVWNEFYANQSLATRPLAAAVIPPQQNAQAVAEHRQQAAPSYISQTAKQRDTRRRQDIQSAIKNKVSAGGKLQAKHHLQSLLFGLGMGALAVFISLFGFFNEVLIAPFIQPGRASASTPLIINSTGVAPTNQPEVIIPKINVEIPVDYNETSTNESNIENDLESGVVHYPTTVLPGQIGNAAFFGHSSNNIFNSGKYKFAFVLLHLLVPGDTFYLTYNSQVYVYKVISKNVVDPSDVGVLGPVSGQTATATLITCDPPGTSWRRLVIVGQQISPDPSGNTQSTTTSTGNSAAAPTNLPGNGPTLWTRYIRSSWGKPVTAVIIIFVVLLIFRSTRRNWQPRLA